MCIIDDTDREWAMDFSNMPKEFLSASTSVLLIMKNYNLCLINKIAVHLQSHSLPSGSAVAPSSFHISRNCFDKSQHYLNVWNPKSDRPLLSALPRLPVYVSSSSRTASSPKKSQCRSCVLQADLQSHFFFQEQIFGISFNQPINHCCNAPRQARTRTHSSERPYILLR